MNSPEADSSVDGIRSKDGTVLPPRREGSEDPKIKSAQIQGQENSDKDPEFNVPLDDEAIVAAISRGELKIFEARETDLGKVVFGCPFCSRPIEIKPRQQGKEIHCEHCSGKMIAPELSRGTQALPVSGVDGVAGAKKVILPQSRTIKGESSQTFIEGRKDFENLILQQKATHRLNDDKIAKLVPKDEAEAGFDMSSAWMSYPDSKGRIPLFLRGIPSIIMLILIVGIVVMLLKKQNKIDQDDLINMGRQRSEGPSNGPASVVAKFSNSDTIEERLQYVRHLEYTKSKMLKSYGEARVGLILPSLDYQTYEEFTVDGLKFCKLRSSGYGNLVPHYLYFQLTKEGGVYLDWESAIGYGEVDIRAFSKWPTDRSVMMRVLVRPAEYYEYEFKDKSLACYGIGDIGGETVIYGYVLRVGNVIAALKKLEFGNAQQSWVPCILKLRAPGLSERRRPMQVQIEEIVSESIGWLIP